ncbi:MAG: hypothetical protein RLZZ127_3116, partial [Planctomycetota bacterium]
MRLLSNLLLLAAAAGPVCAGDAPAVLPRLDAPTVQAAAPLPGGLLVHAGAADAGFAIAMAKSAPWVCAI